VLTDLEVGQDRGVGFDGVSHDGCSRGLHGAAA
jgi:hypothetical protein